MTNSSPEETKEVKPGQLFEMNMHIGRKSYRCLIVDIKNPSCFPTIEFYNLDLNTKETRGMSSRELTKFLDGGSISYMNDTIRLIAP